MPTETDLLATLDRGQALKLISWVAATAAARVSRDFDEDAGHDQAVVGFLSYKYHVDLFDRATSCGRYALPSDAPAGVGLDIVRRGITAEAYDSMPRIELGAIKRSNFRGSPGWAVGDVRWVLQSFSFGHIDKIIWAQKSDTKQAVAQQALKDKSSFLFSFDELGVEEPQTAVVDDSFVGTTLVLCHSFDMEAGSYQEFIGNSKSSEHHGDGPWSWRRLIASGGDSRLGATTSVETDLPGKAPSTDVEDAAVRIRTNRDAETAEQ
ncbi:hypothetical protein C5C00_01585 [Rathayibacter rathayi]|uniref:hypothetical protein n=1 Tax=Rathayibacter rathayi TaxID=33887 RepID=UPI000CE7460C|nr:hypothetical protein [Rathayibacter rathayi]PPG90694.1 hypothetical protein C5C47_00855 [Rathayibacter rathayi]PPG98741.1 hypothetical protein C5C00_01585 [Rathayibacter rathayi]